MSKILERMSSYLQWFQQEKQTFEQLEEFREILRLLQQRDLTDALSFDEKTWVALQRKYRETMDIW